MLVWMTLIAGLAVIVGGVLLVAKVDRLWRPVHLQCCRCLTVWFSRERMCRSCGARGRDYDWLARQFAGFPTHDWQGYLDTGPIPRLTAAPSPITTSVSVPLPRSSSTPVATVDHGRVSN